VDGPYARVPNGVDCTRFRPADGMPHDRPPTALFVGRDDPRKGFADARAAFARVRAALPEARLRVAGIADRSAPGAPTEAGVEYLGHVPPETLPDVYRSADVLLAPSLSGESQGVVLLEALASGVPPIASRIAGYAETVRDGVDGVLVPPGDPSALADAALSLLRDQARRRALGERGRHAASSYDWSRVGAAIAEVLTEATGCRDGACTSTMAPARRSTPLRSATRSSLAASLR
jgi:phosphatidylinositol alpha-mannosyltransferase